MLKILPHLLRNMGWHYLVFRIIYELKLRSGWLKRQFPTPPEQQHLISLTNWRKNAPLFFFDSREALTVVRSPNSAQEAVYEDFLDGKVRFFNSKPRYLGKNYDWLTNPENNYRYDTKKHWTQIPDFSQESGDIKMVWEKSRFAFLYDLIRYDYHHEHNCAALVIDEIDSWMAANPINQGPNWRCSQEISLRVLNWTFALYYYRHDPALSEERFQKIMHCIYWQIKHVEANIQFSRIAVRNNHALTETLMLYLGGLLFPFFPEAERWKVKGRKWFTKEVAYQVYKDGTFLQFSHNYHRVVIQLFSWAFYLSELNGEQWPDVVYERARRSLNYLINCADESNGMLPNYGANDGALFFPLNDTDYRDYRPQLNALYFYFTRQWYFSNAESREDTFWYTANMAPQTASEQPIKIDHTPLQSFENGGIYLIHDKQTLSFLKCTSYRDRPSHADNLHLDIWYRGENILRDAGTYKYNTDQELVRYFNGTSAHNTLSLGHYDQMKKGPRFIWLHWSKRIAAKLYETEVDYIFEGTINAFRHINPKITHSRKVEKKKGIPFWHITDRLQHQTDLPIRQYWNIGPSFEKHFSISAKDENGQKLSPIIQEGYFSSYYAVKELSKVVVFESHTNLISTTIQLK